MRMNWKKPLSFLLALCLIAGLCPALAVPAEAAGNEPADTVTVDGVVYSYSVSGNSVTAYPYRTADDSVTSVTLPATVETPAGLARVVLNNSDLVKNSPNLKTLDFSKVSWSSGTKAFFQGCTTLEEVVLPVTYAIPDSCFQGCTGLKKVVLQEGVSRFYYACFEGCTSLTDINLPDGLTQFDGSCFNGCTSLTSITLPDSLRYIYAASFANCTSLTHIDLPKDLASLGESCFARCTSLTEVTLPESLTSLSSWCFQECTGLREIHLPEGLSRVGQACFDGCTNLTNVNWPKNAATIPDYCFYRCSSLKSFEIPDTVTELGYRAFLISGLTGIELPEGLKTIGDSCFQGAPITELTIPGSVTTLGALYAGNLIGENNIKTLTFKGTDLSGLTVDSRSIPKDVTINIPSGATQPDWLKERQEEEQKQQEETLKKSLRLNKTSLHVNTGIFVTTGGKDEFKRGEYEFTATNRGTAVLTLETPKSEYCEIIMPSRTTLAPGEQATFKIRTKEGLGPGEYSETITIGTREGASADLSVSATVMGVANLSIDQKTLDFGAAGRGYTQPDAKTVTVTNTGTLTLTLEEPANPDFDLTPLSKTTLAPGEQATFTARPKAGLALGTYKGTLLVSGKSDASATNNKTNVYTTATFEVTNQTSSISASPTSLDFGTATVGYKPITAKTVTITNTSKSSVTLQAPTSTNYVLGSLSRTTLAAGETATFTVRPKDGLTKGTYNADLKITGSNGVSVSVSLRFTVKEKGPTFVDVKESDWFYEDVEYAHEKGLVNGVGNNLFDPYGTTTRGQIVTILYRLEGEPTVSGRSSFADVSAWEYYANAVKWASDHQIVNGYSSTQFGPEDPITREQMAAILYRYASYKGYSTGARANLSKFTDASAVSAYAVDALAWANSHKLINGTSDTTLDPQGSAIRAQVAAILHRFCENIAK